MKKYIEDIPSTQNHYHSHGIGHRHDTGGASIDLYAVNSKIRHWPAEFKVGFSILLLLLCLLANHWVISFVVLITAAIITMGFGKLPWHR